jgi:hypothetical protein
LEQARKTEVKSYYRILAGLLGLYGSDTSVTCIQDPEDAEKVVVEKSKVNRIISDHFGEQFADANRKLTDPSLTHTLFDVQTNEIREIVQRIDKNKAMGWAAMPREIIDE